VQSMVYFKPPGARGQALHQDQYYLNVKPGTCVAAWLALDPADERNGCMRVVPASHTWPVLCARKADPTTSFTDTTVELPSDQEVRPVVMDEGDVLFFNGLLVHGSLPNATLDRFRRSLIGHYIPCTASEVTAFDQPLLRMDGTELWLKAAAFGGPCGQWVDRDGAKVLEVSGVNATPTWTHE
jgi:phytanoyl-CoA hydroxylase